MRVSLCKLASSDDRIGLQDTVKNDGLYLKKVKISKLLIKEKWVKD